LGIYCKYQIKISLFFCSPTLQKSSNGPLPVTQEVVPTIWGGFSILKHFPR